MKDRTYIIYSYDKLKYLLGILLPLTIYSFILLFLFKLGTPGHVIAIALTGLLIWLSIWVFPERYAKSVLVVKVRDNALSFFWRKPIWGGRDKILHVPFNEIRSFKNESSKFFSTLTLKILNKKLRIHHSIGDDDEFMAFTAFLKGRIDEYNLSNDSAPPIIIKKNLYENRIFLISAAVFIGLLIVAFVVLLLFKGVQDPKGFFFILIILPSLIWSINRIIKGLRGGSER